jgi:hypothetical protein
MKKLQVMIPLKVMDQVMTKTRAEMIKTKVMVKTKAEQYESASKLNSLNI